MRLGEAYWLARLLPLVTFRALCRIPFEAIGRISSHDLSFLADTAPDEGVLIADMGALGDDFSEDPSLPISASSAARSTAGMEEITSLSRCFLSKDHVPFVFAF